MLPVCALLRLPPLPVGPSLLHDIRWRVTTCCHRPSRRPKSGSASGRQRGIGLAFYPVLARNRTRNLGPSILIISWSCFSDMLHFAAENGSSFGDSTRWWDWLRFRIPMNAERDRVDSAILCRHDCRVHAGRLLRDHDLPKTNPQAEDLLDFLWGPVV